MKKIMLFLLISLSFSACECEFCEDIERDYGRNRTVYYDNDYFCADKLLGTWQMDYGCAVGNIELKEIKFLDGRYCDIIMCKRYDTDWYTETFIYTYYGNTIRFSKNNGTNGFNFRIRGYTFPELYLEDSFGKYTWRKVRSYGC